MSNNPIFPRNNDIGDGKEYSEAFNSKITSVEQDRAKEEKAKLLIEEIVDEKLKPINTQLAEMPNLIKNTIYSVFSEMQQQAQQQQAQQIPQAAAPQSPINIEGLKALADIAGPLLGRGTPQEGAVDFKSMMAEWGMRMFQYHLDNMAQSVYQIKLPPPGDVAARTKKDKPSLMFE